MAQEHLQHYRGRTVLVTGGAGAIGSNLTTALAEAGASKVIVLDDLSSSYRWNVPSRPAVQFVFGSVLDEEALERAFAEEPSIVFHMAALFANQNSIDHPERDLMVNGAGTLRVLQRSHGARVERFVFASSSSAFGGASLPLPLTEETVTLNLSTPYQITKMLGELYCNYFHSSYGLPTVRPRFFNSYGPGEVPGHYRNVIPNFIYLALKHKPLPITGTGDETRDFTYVGDHVNALLRAGFRDEAVGQAFNFGSGIETRVIDLANLINDLTSNPSGTVHTERRDWDKASRRLASIDKARRVLGYEPTVALREGLTSTIAWFRQNWDRIEQGARFAPATSSEAPGLVAAPPQGHE